jgi:hypothetical protein
VYEITIWSASMNFRKVLEYFKALEVKGGVLTAVGLLPFFIDDILRFYFSLSINIPIWLSLPWFILAFGWANFLVYTKLIEEKSLVFEIGEVKTVWLKGIDPNEALINDTIIVGVQLLITISSPNAAKSVRFSIDSVEPNCVVPDGKAEIKLRSATQDLENPCWLRGDEMINIQLIFTIPFSTICLEQSMGSLSRFTELTVDLGAGSPGGKPIYKIIHCSLLEAHERIENEFTTKIQHLPSARFPPNQFLSMLRRYWRGTS